MDSDIPNTGMAFDKGYKNTKISLITIFVSSDHIYGPRKSIENSLSIKIERITHGWFKNVTHTFNYNYLKVILIPVVVFLNLILNM